MIRRLWKGEHGQALVEMALVLPLFLLLLFSVTEMGRIGYAYVTVGNAARAGGRAATIGGTDTTINSSIKNAAVSLDPASLTITITPQQVQRTSGQTVTVQVSYPVQLIIPLISNVIPNPFIVSSSTIMRIE